MASPAHGVPWSHEKRKKGTQKRRGSRKPLPHGGDRYPPPDVQRVWQVYSQTTRPIW